MLSANAASAIRDARLGSFCKLASGGPLRCPSAKRARRIDEVLDRGAHFVEIGLALVFSRAGELDAYERLLTDAMKGESLLFVRQDAVEAAWSIVEPVLGSATPLHAYQQGTWGPLEADILAADIGGWHNPEAQ